MEAEENNYNDDENQGDYDEGILNNYIRRLGTNMLRSRNSESRH